MGRETSEQGHGQLSVLQEEMEEEEGGEGSHQCHQLTTGEGTEGELGAAPWEVPWKTGSPERSEAMWSFVLGSSPAKLHPSQAEVQ